MKKGFLQLTLLVSSLVTFCSIPVLAESQSPTTISSEGTISFDWTDFTPLPGLPEEQPEGEQSDEKGDEEQLGGGWVEISKERSNTQHVLTGKLPQTGETADFTKVGIVLVGLASSFLCLKKIR